MEIRKYPRLEESVCWHTLKNGLKVAIVPRPGFTKKQAYFVTDYGAIHRDFTVDGKPFSAPAGVAHYLEHKLFDMPGRDIGSEFAALGADVNAFTGYDMTAYYFTCTEQSSDCLRLLLEFVSTPYFTKESVAKEQGIIGQEIEMNADLPDTVLFEQLTGAMYENHPIRTPILGTKESIAEITPEVLNACHRAFYRPDNMLLCVVGDVDPEEVISIAEAVLPGKTDEIVEKTDTWQESTEVLQQSISRKMDIAMPMFQLGFKCPPLGRGEAAVRQELIGDLAAEALFGESSPLYLRLYEEGIIDASFGGGYETVEGMSMLTASGDSLQPEKVQESIFQQTEMLLRDGIDGFERMKRSAIGRRIKSLDSFDSTCFRICAYYFSGFDYFDFPRLYDTLKEDEVLAFLRTAITREGCCLSVILPSQQEA